MGTADIVLKKSDEDSPGGRGVVDATGAAGFFKGAGDVFEIAHIGAENEGHSKGGGFDGNFSILGTTQKPMVVHQAITFIQIRQRLNFKLSILYI